MDKGASQNKNDSFFNKYQNWVIGGLVVVALIVYFIVQSQMANDTVDNDDNDGQTQGESTGDTGNNPTPNPSENPSPAPSGSGQVSGNVTSTGVLRTSDNTSRGNYMLENVRSKIYIQTKRDFSSWVGKTVTLDAEGTLDKFVFLGFVEAKNTSPTPGADMGGAPEADQQVKFSGKLQNTDNASKGNYLVVSDDSKVYLQSVRDYSAWVGSDVNLSAYGTINSFKHAVLTK